MKQLVRDYLKKNGIHNTKVIVAVSGGPDSIALLSILDSVKLDFFIDLEAAYLDHGIRNENENKSDYTLIKTLCEELNIKLHVKNIGYGIIESEAEQHKLSVEAIARRERYSFFNSLYNSQYFIALGHNRDDQIETQIMRFFQGSSVDGLTGIKDFRENIIRPLISAPKKEIYSYLSEHNIKYNVDSTNLSNVYLRNRVRNELLPIVKNIFPGYDRALSNIENNLYQLKTLVDGAYHDIGWINEENNYYTNYNEFIELPCYLREKEIFNIFDKTYDGVIKDFRLPRRFLKPLSKNSFKNNELILKGYGFILKRVGSRLVWLKDEINELYYKIQVTGPGTYKNSFYSFNISDSGNGNYIDGLTYPFSIRNPISGYSEMRIIKKRNISVNELQKIIILEKNNKLCAIIYKNEIIYKQSLVDSGIYLEFT